MEPCEQIAALQDASIAITVYSTEHHLASAFLPEKAVLLVLNTKVKAMGLSQTALFRLFCLISWAFEIIGIVYLNV